MTLYANTFDSGTTGAEVTTATMAADGATPTAVESGALVYSTATAHGARAAYCAGTAGRIRYGGLATREVAMRAYIRYAEVPTVDSALLEVGTGGSSFVARSSLIVNSAGKLRLWDDTQGTLWTAASAISALTWYLVELVVLVGTTTSNSTIKASYRVLGDSAEIAGYSTTTGNAGTGNLTDVRFFRKQGPAGSVDSIAFDDASDGSLLGPYTAPAGGNADYALTANYTSNTVTLVSWTVDATGSTGDTSLAQLSGTTATIGEPSTDVWTITNPSGSDDLAFRLTAAGTPADTADFTLSRSTGPSQRPAIWTKQADGSWA